MATNNVKTAFTPCFAAEVFGAKTARALDALLEERMSAEMRHGGVVAMESVPFARPIGISMYEADALTWRFYHLYANNVAHALNNAAYGDALTRALFARLFSSERPEEEAHPLRPSSVDEVRAAIATLRRTLRALCISD
jgi:hypothetical protein